MPMYGVGVHGARKSSRRQRYAACEKEYSPKSVHARGKCAQNEGM